uniref:Uncharacterized protein n=1 Tax=Anguilla anguilla TaxID=7936 RepID=A0A0E9WZN8_ANGAN
MMFSLSVFNVITDSMLTKSVPSSDTGTMLGLCASEMSLVRTYRTHHRGLPLPELRRGLLRVRPVCRQRGGVPLHAGQQCGTR